MSDSLTHELASLLDGGRLRIDLEPSLPAIAERAANQRRARPQKLIARQDPHNLEDTARRIEPDPFHNSFGISSDFMFTSWQGVVNRPHHGRAPKTLIPCACTRRARKRRDGRSSSAVRRGAIRTSELF